MSTACRRSTQVISPSSPLNLAKAISPRPSHPMIGRLGWGRRSGESLAPGSVDEPGLPAGTAIGRYRLVEAGAGPTGHSYRAPSTDTGRAVVCMVPGAMPAHGGEGGS